MKPVIKIFDNPNELARFFAHLVVSAFKKTEEGRKISIALSGGSTPKCTFEYLAKFYHNLIDWKKILVFWSDERCVPPESTESNYKMAKESLLDHVPCKLSNIFRIKGESVPEEEAGRYSDIVLNKVSLQDNIPRFDLVMLGLGDDGHTASIFPDSLNLIFSNNLFEVSENPYTKQKRITATGKLINHSKAVVFLVQGKGKAEILARVIEKTVGWQTLPAAWINPEHGEMFWLLDQDAAQNLNKIQD